MGDRQTRTKKRHTPLARGLHKFLGMRKNLCMPSPTPFAPSRPAISAALLWLFSSGLPNYRIVGQRFLKSALRRPSPIIVRVSDGDSVEWEGPLCDFIASNVDDEESCEQARALKPGGSMVMGMGFVVQRIGYAPSAAQGVA